MAVVDLVTLFIVGIIILIILGLSIRVVSQYERGVHFRFGKIIGVRDPGLRLIIPVIDRLEKISLRIVTMPVPAQKIITQDNVSIDVAAVAFYKVVNAYDAVVDIENYNTAVNQIAQTTMRNVIGQFLLDDVLSSTSKINEKIKEIIDKHSEPWGVQVTAVEIKDIIYLRRCGGQWQSRQKQKEIRGPKSFLLKVNSFQPKNWVTLQIL